MGWLQDNLGMMVVFVVTALVLVIIIGLVSGKFPSILDTVRGLFCV